MISCNWPIIKITIPNVRVLFITDVNTLYNCGCRIGLHFLRLDFALEITSVSSMPLSKLNTVEPLWKGQESLTKVAKFDPFPCTILYKSSLFYPSWKATSFERPSSCVAFIEGFHCITLLTLWVPYPYMRYPKFFISAPVDGLTPNDTGPSAGTTLITKKKIFSKFSFVY